MLGILHYGCVNGFVDCIEFEVSVFLNSEVLAFWVAGFLMSVGFLDVRTSGFRYNVWIV